MIQAVAAAVRKKKHSKIQACLWKGMNAVRKRSLTATLKQKTQLKLDAKWLSTRMRILARETQGIRSIASYLRWRGKEMNEGMAATAGIGPADCTMHR